MKVGTKYSTGNFVNGPRGFKTKAIRANPGIKIMKKNIRHTKEE